MQIGCKVTLRGRKMYEFMDRLISLALPRVRDFRGISRKAFDGNGSYSLGLSEQLVFPELNPDKFTRVQGMNITFVIRNATDDESRELLTQLGMPFQVEEVKAPRRRIVDSILSTICSEDPLVASKSKFAKAKRDAEIRHAVQAALQVLRPSAGRVSQVRHLPDLFSQISRPGFDPRRAQGQLVSGSQFVRTLAEHAHRPDRRYVDPHPQRHRGESGRTSICRRPS